MKPLKVLLVEDNSEDAALVLAVMAREGFQVSYKQVMTYGELSSELDQGGWDIVISDFSLPAFSGPEALELVRRRDPEIPFILVSGTISDETAVATIKGGANDYVLKDKLSRLGPAVSRELAEAQNRRKLKAELAAKEEQLRQAQKMEILGSLAGGIVHDFNNFLALVMMGCEVALTEIDGPDSAKSLLEDIRSATDRAAGLTRQLLTFCRRQVVNRTSLDLNECVRASQSLLKRVLPEQIDFQIELHPKPLMVHMDPTQLDQVLMNLIVNAKDAMPGGGKLTVKTSFAKDQAVVEIRDTGSGIPQELRTRIFDPFFTTKDKDKGTGLGLSTVKTILDDSQATIRVDSKPGGGTTFILNFPIHSADTPATRPAGATIARAAKETVLLVEDERTVRDMMSEVLQRSGYTVLTAATAPQALEVVRDHKGPIHLLLSDMSLPETNGLELAYLISQLRRETQVLFVTGYYDRELFESQNPDVALKVLQKPFSRAGLLEKVMEVLDANPAN